jgi:hypothetical protein
VEPTSEHRGPISDADTNDIIDNAVTALAERRGGLWLGDDTVLIHLLVSLIDQAERWLPHAVDGARDEGATWDDIAALLDTSPQEAWLRFAPDSPIADARWPWLIEQCPPPPQRPPPQK